jgi:hypothetical protein
MKKLLRKGVFKKFINKLMEEKETKEGANSKQFLFHCSNKEMQELNSLAKHLQMSKAQIIRTLIHAAFAELTGE